MAVLQCILLLTLSAFSSAAATAPWPPSTLTASHSDDATASVRQQELSSSTDDSLAVDGGGVGRSLLHGCHGRNRNSRCFRNLPQCPDCRFPRRSTDGHCKETRTGRIFNCRRRSDTTYGEFYVDDYVHGPNDGYYLDYGDYDPVRFRPPPRRPPPRRPPPRRRPLSLDLRRVSSPSAFQAALDAGVRHIVLTAHLDMRRSPSPPDILGAEALNAGVARLDKRTVSIVGRCNSRAPSFFNLKESRPSGACGILVKEDFLDIPRGSGDLLLDSLYVAVESRPGSSSSVLLLHTDGQLWITNSVFQGAGTKSRAIDVSTDDGGKPKLFVQDTVFRDFKRDLAPGIRVTNGAPAYLDRVTFRNLEVLRKTRGDIVEASAIAAYPGATLSLVDVTFSNNKVLGRSANNQVVGVSSRAPKTIAYADPQRLVWQWPSGGLILTATKAATSNFLRRTVAPVATAMRRAQQNHRDAEFRNP